MNNLAQLHADIETRVKAIRDSHSDWLCRQGCDGCCRRLAEVPRITAEEWDSLQEGLAALPPERLREISQEIAALAGQVSRPIVCPMLDRADGACLVYVQRPVACRTFGFYVQRDLGLYCKDIESHVAEARWRRWCGATITISIVVSVVWVTPAICPSGFQGGREH